MRTHPKALTAFTASSLGIVFLLTACGGGSNGTAEVDPEAIANVTDEQLEGIQIDMARFFGDCSDDVGDNTDLSQAVGECETIETLTNQFNAENEYGITVSRLGGAAWDSYYDSLNSAFAGGNPPDVAIMHGSSLVDYAERGLLLPMDEMAETAGIDLADAVPAAQTAISYEDSAYGVPFDVHAALAHVNVDLFREAGLVDEAGAPIMPSSPEEFLEAAQQMEEATGKNYFAVARSGDQLGVHMFESLLNQQGVGVLNEDGTEATLDTPEAREALSFMDEIFSSGYADGNQTYDAAQQSFLNGEAAVLFNGTWVVDQYNQDAPFEYRATNFPTLYSEPGVWADSHTWVIPKQDEGDPVRYRAALEYMSYLYENSGEWALGTGHISARESVLKSEEYQAAPQRANYADTGLTVAKPVPHISNWPAVSTALVQSIESIWFQDTPVDEALQNGQSAIQSALSGS